MPKDTLATQAELAEHEEALNYWESEISFAVEAYGLLLGHSSSGSAEQQRDCRKCLLHLQDVLLYAMSGITGTLIDASLNSDSPTSALTAANILHGKVVEARQAALNAKRPDTYERHAQVLDAYLKRYNLLQD
ncbi:MAG: hypothetical protein OXG92_12675 [Chloroflexi bacterium]|nr:hypothetical protein [Chloroflexota bacterium]MCY3581456.1 hypothetical protein [Chloroflexota bacterium]MCY3717307.1 hypothetical protein [Chloroflexota bacterium]MDE2649224.1 hypothetical protein [Chloroflexota bacterium]MXV92690.1 hypothetical protein [Chloroflexota bacterium]